MDLGLKGRRAIVCASSKGLGRGCAMALAQEGVDLVINSRSADMLEATAGEIRKATGVTVTVRWEGRRLEASAFGIAGARLDDRLAGERVLVGGRVRPDDTDWLRWRHVVGRLTINDVLAHESAAPIFAAANWVRRQLSEHVDKAAVVRTKIMPPI